MNETELLKLFSRNLKRMMDEDKIKEEDLAKGVGLSQATISRYVTGRSLPSYITVVKIADALFCSLDDFLVEDKK